MKYDIFNEIEILIDYAVAHGFQVERDRLYIRHSIYSFLNLVAREPAELEHEKTAVLPNIYEILARIKAWGISSSLLEADSIVAEDLFTTKLLGLILPRPSEVEHKFSMLKAENSKKATDYLYELSQSSTYIRTDRLAKNSSWDYQSEYGKLIITINLAKPEKDPKDIALAMKQPPTRYPSCVLCKENEAYPGHYKHPPRANHRIVELDLASNKFYLQYSPYLYYPEHSIILAAEHKTMFINEQSFNELASFIEQFPHYMVGSNADLPIVGGSILSHHHFQAGKFHFPLFDAKVLEHWDYAKTAGVSIEHLYWPLSVLRLRGQDKIQMLGAATDILNAWRRYKNEELAILPNSTASLHNTITPIFCREAEEWIFYLVLRNNRQNSMHPMGIFHPHSEVHHIKKENIGLIEVLGLAILPGRLDAEIEFMLAYLSSKKDSLAIAKHKTWLDRISSKANINKYNKEELRSWLKEEIARVFTKAISHCQVLPATANNKHWNNFVSSFTTG